MLTQEIKIPSGYSDFTVRLGVAHSFYVLQDAMTGCLEIVDCGNLPMKRRHNVFWVISKAKTEYTRFPNWGETVVLSAEFESVGKIRAVLKTQLHDKAGNLLMTGWQELCLLDFERHRPQKLAEMGFPLPQKTLPVEFTRFEDLPVQKVYEHTVRSAQIDMSHHVNNVEYVKMAMSCLTVAEVEAIEIQNLEAHFIAECMEGETLTISEHRAEDSAFFRITAAERTVFEMTIHFSPK